jgi:hypothetical protein
LIELLHPNSKIKVTYPNTHVIIDCTELLVEMPTSFRSQSATYSSCKNHNTAKRFIGISPADYPTFMSDYMLGGLVINKSPKIVVFLISLSQGIMLWQTGGEHRHIDIENDKSAGVGLNIPPFFDGALQLSCVC